MQFEPRLAGNAKTCNQNTRMSEADLKEIEKKIEEAAEPEEEKEDAEVVAHAALMETLDQVIDCLSNSKASEEMISLGKELCKVVDSIATPTVGGVKMIINPGAEAGAAAEPRPSTSRAANANYLIANANYPLRVRAHRVGVWVRQATRKAEFQKGEAEANLKEIEQEIMKATEAIKSQFNWEKPEEKDDQIFRSALNARL